MGTFVSGLQRRKLPFQSTGGAAPNDNVLVNFFFVKIAMVITDTLDEREIENPSVKKCGGHYSYTSNYLPNANLSKRHLACDASVGEMTALFDTGLSESLFFLVPIPKGEN